MGFEIVLNPFKNLFLFWRKRPFHVLNQSYRTKYEHARFFYVPLADPAGLPIELRYEQKTIRCGICDFFVHPCVNGAIGPGQLPVG